MQRSATLSVMIEVWREVAGHLEIQALVEAVAPRLRGQLPLTGLAVVRLDPLPQRLDVLAATRMRAGGMGLEPSWVDDRERLSTESLLRRMLVELRERGEAAPRAGLWGALLASEDGLPHAVVVQIAEPAPHAGLLGALIEPLQVALVNDRRVHELARLREAAEADNRALLTRLERQDIAETVVGERTGLREVMQRIDQVAPTDAPVLILGETGSGKEVLARSVHERSRRASGPFLRVNCGAIPAELVDSELFGHEKGSFTGAVTTRRGWFERADGGTLFLDELGELPAAAQVRLLRVLQDGTFERVGGQRALRADVRVIAATHRDMPRLIAEGRFREDLWYRVAVFPITLPSLRDRMEDIGELTAHFASRAGKRLRGAPLQPTPDDIALLAAYDWPGNVRELAAVVERAAILGDGRRLDVARALGGGLPRPAPKPPRTEAEAPPPPSVVPPVGGTFEDIARAAILEALRAANGQIQGPGGAAERLRINPSTLRSRMEKLGIPWRRARSAEPDAWAADMGRTKVK